MTIDPWLCFWLLLGLIVAWSCRGVIALFVLLVGGGILLGLMFLLLLCGVIGADTYDSISRWIGRKWKK